MQPVDAQTKAKFDEVLARANSLRLRGDLEGAAATCRQALAVWQEGVEAWELLGDVLAAQMETQQALEAYRRARELAPGEARVEDKYALALLSLQDQRQLPAVEERLSRQAADKERAKALRLAILFPGAGHHYLGERTEGLILIGVAVIAAMALWSALMRMAYPSPEMEMRGTGLETLIALVAAAVYLGALSYSVFDVWRLCRVYFPVKPPWHLRPPTAPSPGQPPSGPPEKSGEQQPPPH